MRLSAHGTESIEGRFAASSHVQQIGADELLPGHFDHVLALGNSLWSDVALPVQEIGGRRAGVGAGGRPVSAQVHPAARLSFIICQTGGQLLPVVHHVGQPVVRVEDRAIRRTERRNANRCVILNRNKMKLLIQAKQ